MIKPIKIILDQYVLLKLHSINMAGKNKPKKPLLDT